jgi:hypothetical protein
MRRIKLKKSLVRATALASALAGVDVLAGTSTNSSGSATQQGIGNPAITISFSGQTALRAFNTSPGITELTPGTTIVLHDGGNSTAVKYTAPSGPGVYVQLASPDFTSPDVNPGTPSVPSNSNSQTASAIRLEWHEQGSVDGFYDLINDEIGYVQQSQTNVYGVSNYSGPAYAPSTYYGPISNEALRTPSSSNPTWINTQKFTTGATTNGFTLDDSASDILDATYSTNVYNQATGTNIQGGQNRIQFSVGENPLEGVSQPGVSSPLLPSYNLVVGGVTSTYYAITNGYGLGNTALTTASTYTGLGVGNVRQQFQPTTILNESTNIYDPVTATSNTPNATYAAGPWNTAGVNNITSTNIAAVGVTYSANPGTGLERLDKGDAQWLQVTGRLQNGALFNVVARTVDTGQRIVFADNTGVDPSWAVGSNDDGNSTSTANANLQHSIGPSLRFDGKTSGSEAEKTIAQSRMAVGALSVPEANAAASNAPIRALNIDFTDQTNVNPADDSTDFIEADFNSIVSNGSGDDAQDSYPRYQAVLISHYNTVKAPNQTALNEEETLLGYNTNTATAQQQQTAWADVQSFNPAVAETDGFSPSTPVSGIQGDPTGDVAAYISNIVNSIGTAGANLTAGSVNNPGDNLYINGFLTPGLLDWTRTTDGAGITNTATASQETSLQGLVSSNYGSLFSTDSGYAANSETVGVGSYYAAGNSTTNAYAEGKIAITAYNGSSAESDGTIAPGGNYLFGNFAQNGVRDYNAVVIDGLQALAALENTSNSNGYIGNSIFSGQTNSYKVTTNSFTATSLPGITNTYQLPASLASMIGYNGTAGATKGDLIVLGDFNGDGAFNGEDLYLLAIGASLADSTSSTTLTANYNTFSDALRNPNDVLRKNAALDYLNTYATLQIRSEARAVLSGSSVPYGATDLHTTDPITGLEQYTYDPNGLYAFNPSDVNRAGLVDVNDAVDVDNLISNSYSNLTQSAEATIPTPVTGVPEPVNLTVVQQIDGESAISSADVNVVNQAMTGPGNANWYGYNLQKTGPSTIVWGRTAGTDAFGSNTYVTVYPGASFEVSNGAFDIAGNVDPFTDDHPSGPTAGNHVALTIDSGGVVNLQQNQGVVTVSGLTINNLNEGSKFNIGNGSVVIAYTNGVSPQSTIRSYIQAGFDNFNWDGPGITSSVAQADAANPGSSPYGGVAAIGYADNSDLGRTDIPGNSVLVRFTYYGDADLNGVVDLNDFDDWLYGFTGGQLADGGNGWANGDFDYDGTVDLNDFDLWLAGFTSGLGSLSTLDHAIDVSTLSSSQKTQLLDIVSSVPEPASFSLLAAGTIGLLSRRRRKVARKN